MYLDNTLVVQAERTVTTQAPTNITSDTVTALGYYNSTYFVGSDGRTYYYVIT